MTLTTNDRLSRKECKRAGYFIARLLLPALYLISITSVQAVCLEIRDSGLEVEESHANMVTARWYVEVSNRCDDPYDGTLRVTVDISSTRVDHESVGFVVVQPDATERVDGTLTLPVSTLEEVNETDYRIMERKRPG